MAMSINTNMGSLRAQQAAANVSNDMQQAMNRLSTGQRINSASDDAAGSAIASRLTSEIRGTNQAIRNALDSQALIDTAEGAQQEIENILQRMRELAVQAANDTNSDGDRANIQLEIDQLATELDRIAVSTTWGGKQLLNGGSGNNPATSFDDATNFKFQIGGSAKAADSIEVSMGAVSAQALGVAGGASGVEVSSTSFSSASGDPAASMTFVDGVLTINGDVKVGDVFAIEVNDVSVSVTVAVGDGFNASPEGVASLLRQKIIDTQIAQYTNGSEDAMFDVDVVDLGGGSLEFSQIGTPRIKNPSASASNEVTVEGGKVSITGTYATGDVIKVNILGTDITVTADTTTDEYEGSNTGLASQLAQKIRSTTAINEFVRVQDNSDGTINLSMSTTPTVDQLTTTVSPAAVNKMTESGGAITVAGAVVEGRVYSAEILGTKVSVTASMSDSYSNDVTGIAEQLADAINAANIAGVDVTASSGVATVNMQPVLTSVEISSDAGGVNKIASTTSSGTITLYGTSTSAATQASASVAMDAGDVIKFTLDGNDFEVSVGTDGFQNTLEGVAEQIGSIIKDFDPTYTVTTTAANTIVVTRTATDFISNLTVTDPTSSLSYNDGMFNVGDNVAVGDVFEFSMEGKDFVINAETSSRADIASQIATAINDAGFEALVATDNGDGTVSIAGGGVDVSSAANALASLDAIDNAMTLLSKQRSTLGSITNRIDSSVRNMTNVVVNLEGGRGRIQDADFAVESSNLAKSQILNQAATAMLAQANASQQTVLSLLQG